MKHSIRFYQKSVRNLNNVERPVYNGKYAYCIDFIGLRSKMFAHTKTYTIFFFLCITHFVRNLNDSYNYHRPVVMFLSKLHIYLLANFVALRMKHLVRWMLHQPIYYSYFSRDCDMCETAGVNKMYGTYRKYLKMVSDFYEDAEGACSISIITADEYHEQMAYEEENGRYFRDRVLEAYENGRGNSIYV